jgi:hypothetical protein
MNLIGIPIVRSARYVECVLMISKISFDIHIRIRRACTLLAGVERTDVLDNMGMQHYIMQFKKVE